VEEQPAGAPLSFDERVKLARQVRNRDDATGRRAMSTLAFAGALWLLGWLLVGLVGAALAALGLLGVGWPLPAVAAAVWVVSLVALRVAVAVADRRRDPR
jgi:hypothetical protein